MSAYAVVVDGICDVTTVVYVEQAADADDAQLQALELAKAVPGPKWEHGEISVSETGDCVELTKATLFHLKAGAAT